MVSAVPHGENRGHDGTPDEEKQSKWAAKPSCWQSWRVRRIEDPGVAARGAERRGEESWGQEASHGSPQAEDPLRGTNEPYAQDYKVSKGRVCMLALGMLLIHTVLSIFLNIGRMLTRFARLRSNDLITSFHLARWLAVANRCTIWWLPSTAHVSLTARTRECRTCQDVSARRLDCSRSRTLSKRIERDTTSEKRMDDRLNADKKKQTQRDKRASERTNERRAWERKLLCLSGSHLCCNVYCCCSW